MGRVASYVRIYLHVPVGTYFSFHSLADSFHEKRTEIVAARGKRDDYVHLPERA